MQKANATLLLHFKRFTWLVLPTSLSINSAADAAESSPAKVNHYVEDIAISLNSTLTDIVNNVPSNTLAWLSLSAIMTILFFNRYTQSK